MKKIAIYGAGGLGRELLLMIRQMNATSGEWEIMGFYDDAKEKGTCVDDVSILGGIQEVNAVAYSLAIAIAIADPAVRKKIVDGIQNTNIDYPVLMHPTAQPGSHKNVFKKGTLITAGVICTTGIHIEEFVIINLASTIGHDVSIGSFSTIMPGCHISGNVALGNGVLLGTGASVLQNLDIGNQAKVGAGAVVINNVPNAVTVVGVPARQKF